MVSLFSTVGKCYVRLANFKRHGRSVRKSQSKQVSLKPGIMSGAEPSFRARPIHCYWQSSLSRSGYRSVMREFVASTEVGATVAVGLAIIAGFPSSHSSTGPYGKTIRSLQASSLNKGCATVGACDSVRFYDRASVALPPVGGGNRSESDVARSEVQTPVRSPETLDSSP